MHTYMILVLRSLSAILAEHREKYLDIDKFNTYRIRVQLWDDGCEELRRNFNVRKHLKVKFIGEKGEDGGGPKREFFFQIMEAMGNQHMLLGGPKGSCTPKHNVMALQSKQFYLIGKIIALSVLNGGPAPKFFSQPILDYLFYGHVRGTRANALCYPEKEMQEKVLMVSTEIHYYVNAMHFW